MTPSPHPWPAEKIRSFRRELLAFFDTGGRKLPWREETDPYAILVSEVMLQQTRVETVVPYYRRWMERFPDSGALAEAEEEEVLRLWQGLGYYSRARNLHRAARELEAEYGGVLPDSPRELRRLPGVGPYTAGAVASIAFQRAVPAVDGNVRRVMSRLMDVPSPTAGELARWVAPLVDPQRPGDFNQALMELGALLCRPRNPECSRCPVGTRCLARGRGTVEHRPLPRAVSSAPRVTEAVAVLVREGPAPAVLLRRRPTHGLLGGMWECPGDRVEEGAAPAAVVGRLAEELVGVSKPGNGPAPGPEASPGESGFLALPPVDHEFSHLKVTYIPFLSVLVRGSREAELPLAWVPFQELERRPLPVAQQRILAATMEKVSPGGIQHPDAKGGGSG